MNTFEVWKGRPPFPQNNTFVKFFWFPRHFWKPLYPWRLLLWTLGEPQISLTLPFLVKSLNKDNISPVTNLSPIPMRQVLTNISNMICKCHHNHRRNGRRYVCLR